MNQKVILINVINPKISKTNPQNVFDIQRGSHFPLGVVCIGAYLKECLPETCLWVLDDQLMSDKEIEEKIEKIKPTVVGINSMFTGYGKALNFARKAKQSGARVVMGGHYPSAMFREILVNRGIKSRDYCVDVVVRGDGKEAFGQYVADKLISKINNLAYYQGNQIKVNKLKVYPLTRFSVDSEILDPRPYFLKYQKMFKDSSYKNPFIVSSQKGCAWRAKPKGGCLFCSLMYKEYFLKDPKLVWSEIDELVNRYQVDYIWDVADDLLGNLKWFEQYHREAKKYKKRPFLKIQSRVNNLINENTVKKLLDLKIGQLFIGFESNDDNCLKQMNKGTTSLINGKAINLLLKYRIPIHGYFIFGNPGETKKSINKTVKLIEKIMKTGKNNIVVPCFFTPLPNSPAYQMVKKMMGRKYKDKDIIDWGEIINDWVELYCRVDYREIAKALDYSRGLAQNINAFSF